MQNKMDDSFKKITKPRREIVYPSGQNYFSRQSLNEQRNYIKMPDILMIIIIIAIVMFFKSPFGKGLLGEMLVNFAIHIRLDKQKYHLLKNITLPTIDGTTQIDHIIVSQYGIFVIETKNMKGWIFGDEHKKVWTQKIFKHTTKFQNPLHQNYKHLKTLESSLNVNLDKIFSVIVFVGDSTFKTKMPKNVTYAGGLFSFIDSKNKILLSSEEVKNIISTIENGRLSKNFKTHREHIEHVNNIVSEKKHKNICPRCNNELVLRTVKKGTNKGKQFYGCSSYPKCRYTKQDI